MSSSDDSSLHPSSFASESSSDLAMGGNYQDLSGVPSEVMQGPQKSHHHGHHGHGHHHRAATSSTSGERKKAKKKDKDRHRSSSGTSSISNQSGASSPQSVRKTRVARERTASGNSELPPNYADLPDVAHVAAAPAAHSRSRASGRALAHAPSSDAAARSGEYCEIDVPSECPSSVSSASRDTMADSQDHRAEYAELSVASELQTSGASSTSRSTQPSRPSAVKSYSTDDGDDRSENYMDLGGVPSEVLQNPAAQPQPKQPKQQQHRGSRAAASVSGTPSSTSSYGGGDPLYMEQPDAVAGEESSRQYADFTSGIPSERPSQSSSPKISASAAAAAPPSDSPAQYFDVSSVPVAEDSPRQRSRKSRKDSDKKPRRRKKDSDSGASSAEVVSPAESEPIAAAAAAPARVGSNPASPTAGSGVDMRMRASTTDSSGVASGLGSSRSSMHGSYSNVITPVLS